MKSGIKNRLLSIIFLLLVASNIVYAKKPQTIRKNTNYLYYNGINAKWGPQMGFGVGSLKIGLFGEYIYGRKKAVSI